MATVVHINEREDGSAEVILDLEADEVQMLLSDALQRAILNYIEGNEQ